MSTVMTQQQIFIQQKESTWENYINKSNSLRNYTNKSNSLRNFGEYQSKRR